MEVKELNEKYKRLQNWEEEYRKELISYINEAFAMHGNEFVYKCDTHDTWKEKSEDEEDDFDAMNDLPTYVMIEDRRGDSHEIYPTRIYREVHEGGSFMDCVDGYDWTDGEFVEGWYPNSHNDDLASIATFINAVLEQESEADGIECKSEMPDESLLSSHEKAEKLLREEGFFYITSVHRDDLEAKGFDVSEVTDEQMKRLASKMCDDYCTQLFHDSMEMIAEDMGIPKKNEACDDEE